ALPDKKAARLEAERKLRLLEEQRLRFTQTDSQASLDSELMLLWHDNYPLYRWVINPLYWRYPEELRRALPPVLMTARLDGPSAGIAKRLVDDAVAAEQKGLAGKVYVDARGIPFDPQADPTGTGYGGYDESFREMAVLLEHDAKMDVTADNADALFPPGRCLNCALYCGWDALTHHPPCCQFVRGAVACALAHRAGGS